MGIVKIEIAHLYQHAAHFPVVAGWIYNEWWLNRPGYSVASLEARLRQASDPDAIPLSLLAIGDGRPVGTVNLVQNDNTQRPHLYPWLAAMLVQPQWRGVGVGSKLVVALLAEARRLHVSHLYLGTDIPEFYARFGAQIHEQVTEEFCIMRLNSKT